MNSKVDVKSYAGFREITWICLFILYAPLIVVTVYSFNASASIAAWEAGLGNGILTSSSGRKAQNLKKLHLTPFR